MYFQLNPPPGYIQERIELFDQLLAKYKTEVAGMFLYLGMFYSRWLCQTHINTAFDFVLAKPREPLKVTLPDGKLIDGTTWETSPYDIAKKIR